MSQSPAVLIVDDDAALCAALRDALLQNDVPALTASDGSAALDVLEREQVGLVITDRHMQPLDGIGLLDCLHEQHPEIPAVLMTGDGSIRGAIDVMRKGAVDYLVKPFEIETLHDVVARYRRKTMMPAGPVAADDATKSLLNIAERVAKTNVTVTIGGPSGSGKEVIARYIHACSPRRDKPFVAINCAAIPESMLEAILFGHEKGAFTGASNTHAGKFEQANGGTLLLDEVSEMNLGLQAKLLRVLQEKEVERIGGQQTIALDVRVLTTTNRDLKQFVADGRFREDLYYRLNVFPLYVPALKDRRQDILPLVEHVMLTHGSHDIELTDAARTALLAHDWPGNVRELENLIQRSLILLSSKTLDASDLAFEEHSTGDLETGLSEGLKSHEFQIIIDALKTHGGRRKAVAEALNISSRSLRYKLARMREEGIAIPGESV